MKTLTLLLAIGAIVVGSCPAQKRRNAPDYTAKIIQIEKNLCNESFDTALLGFRALFETGHYIFKKDIYAAAQLAYYNHHNKETLVYLQRYLAKGGNLKTIKKNKILRSFLKSDEGYMLQTQLDSLKKEQQLYLDLELRTTLHQMFKKDQKKAFGALLRIGDKAQIKYSENVFGPHSIEQVTQLKDILETHGYPSEKLIGNNYWATTILSHHNSISSNFNQKDSLYQSLYPLLVQACKTGEMSVYELAYIENWRLNINEKWRRSTYGYLSKSLTPSELVYANELREAIGLRSVQTRNHLIDLQLKYGFDWGLPRISNKNQKIKY